MAEKPDLDGEFTQLDDGKYVSLVEYDGSLGDHEPITVDLDQWADFIEKAREMGWEQTRLYVKDNSPVLAREQGDDGDVFVALAPMIVDGNESPEGDLEAESEDVPEPAEPELDDTQTPNPAKEDW